MSDLLEPSLIYSGPQGVESTVENFKYSEDAFTRILIDDEKGVELFRWNPGFSEKPLDCQVRNPDIQKRNGAFGSFCITIRTFQKSPWFYKSMCDYLFLDVLYGLQSLVVLRGLIVCSISSSPRKAPDLWSSSYLQGVTPRTGAEIANLCCLEHQTCQSPELVAQKMEVALQRAERARTTERPKAGWQCVVQNVMFLEGFRQRLQAHEGGRYALEPSHADEAGLQNQCFIDYGFYESRVGSGAHFGWASTQGKRPHMQDHWAVAEGSVETPSYEGVPYLHSMVIDGHGNDDEFARYLKDQFHRHFIYQFDRLFKTSLARGWADVGRGEVFKDRRALFAEAVDVALFNALKLAPVDVTWNKSSQYSNDGACIAGFFIIGRIVYAYTVGDCRISAYFPDRQKGSRFCQLTADHTPESDLCRTSNKRRGGELVSFDNGASGRMVSHDEQPRPEYYYRVLKAGVGWDGTSAATLGPGRSIGDHGMMGGISSRGTISKLILEPGERVCLFSASDGVSEGGSTNQTLELLEMFIGSGVEGPGLLAALITEVSCLAGSTDNITSLVCQYRAPEIKEEFSLSERSPFFDLV